MDNPLTPYAAWLTRDCGPDGFCPSSAASPTSSRCAMRAYLRAAAPSSQSTAPASDGERRRRAGVRRCSRSRRASPARCRRRSRADAAAAHAVAPMRLASGAAGRARERGGPARDRRSGSRPPREQRLLDGTRRCRHGFAARAFVWDALEAGPPPTTATRRRAAGAKQRAKERRGGGRVQPEDRARLPGLFRLSCPLLANGARPTSGAEGAVVNLNAEVSLAAARRRARRRQPRPRERALACSSARASPS